jgi:hypothetical protein
MKKSPESKQLSAESWAIVRKNRSLLSFPVIGGLLSLVPILIFWIPGAVLLGLDKNIPGFIFVAIGLVASVFIVQYALAALVLGADDALHDRPVSIGGSFGRALKRTPAILGWSVINAVMQIFVGFLQGDDSGSGIGSVVMAIFRAIFGAIVEIAWRLITWLVIPFIMFDDAGPVTSIRNSFDVFREHWGTQIRGFARITFSWVLVLTLPGFLLVIGGIVLAVNDNAGIGLPLILVGVILMVLGALLFNTVRGVFSVVMYRYLKDGKTLGGFSTSQLEAAVMSDSRS